MKRIVFLLTMLLSALTYGQSSPTGISLIESSRIDTLSQKKLKSIKISEFKGKEVFGDIVRSKRKSSSTKVYDIKGNLLEEYKDDILRYSKKYDINNNVIEKIIYNNGVFYRKIVYKYDINNNNIEEYYYNEKSELYNIYIRKYFNNKLIAEYEVGKVDPSMKGNSNYVFDEKKDTLMKNPFYPGVGIVIESTIYTYNTQDLLIDKSNYRVDMDNISYQKLRKKEKYKYDSNNNLVSTTSYNSDGSVKEEDRRKYNSDNKIIESACQNPHFRSGPF